MALGLSQSVFDMNAGTVASSAQQTDPTRLFLVGTPPERRLLLPPHVERREFTTETITIRATTITVVLEKIMEQRGFPHGGINE